MSGIRPLFGEQNQLGNEHFEIEITKNQHAENVNPASTRFYENLPQNLVNQENQFQRPMQTPHPAAQTAHRHPPQLIPDEGGELHQSQRDRPRAPTQRDQAPQVFFNDQQVGGQFPQPTFDINQPVTASRSRNRVLAETEVQNNIEVP